MYENINHKASLRISVNLSIGKRINIISPQHLPTSLFKVTVCFSGVFSMVIS